MVLPLESWFNQRHSNIFVPLFAFKIELKNTKEFFISPVKALNVDEEESRKRTPDWDDSMRENKTSKSN